EEPVTPKARPAASRLTAVCLFAAVLLTATLAAALAAPVALKTTELGRGPTIVFVHGLGASRNDWLPTARKLLGRYRVVLVDLPGHGESPLPDPFSFVTVGEALDAVLAKQNPDSTIVVAHQIGGRVALAAFAAHPGRAKGLVLIDVPVGLPIAIDDQQKKQFLEFMDSNYEAVASRMFSNMGRDTTQSKAIYTMFTQTPPATVKAYVREGFFSDGNKDAKAAKVPEQLVVTSRVWKPGMTSGSVLKTMGWEDTTARAIRVADAAFWVMKDQPDTLAAIVSQFATARIAAKK
ncbi:MAG TPA: alpha/beta hydrolase, partial [Methylomirabilota bacterium]|nr:alpha/beta hydrolase [Methylomirabilota bacterium]